MPRTCDHLGRLVSWGAHRSPHRVAIKHVDGSARTYLELEQRTSRLANALLGAGLARGDRVAAWLSDSVEYVELYHAVAKAGLVMVPINASYTANEAQFQLEDSGARALVFDSDRVDRVLAISGVEDIPVRLAVGSQRPVKSAAFEDVLERGAASLPPEPDGDDPFLLGYTSGTTGFPKGAILTHRSVSAIARMNAVSYHLPLASTVAFSGSMSFVASVTAVLYSHWHVGGTVVLMGSWKPDKLFDVIEAERATFTYFPTSELLSCAAEADRRPESWRSLDGILQSASKADPAHIAEVASVVGDRLVMGWGMTENSGGLLTATSKQDFDGDCRALELYASSGRATADAMVEVVDVDGRPLPHDGETVGELIGRTPALMRGYWKNEEATARALRDGWYWSGDMGMIDPAGYVYIAGRRRDLIVSGGMNIYPSEIERVITSLQGVREVAVVAAPHERWGQTPVAFVVEEPGASLDEAAVIAHCRSQLASFKKPTRVMIREALPRTTSGKIQKHVLEREVTLNA